MTPTHVVRGETFKISLSKSHNNSVIELLRTGKKYINIEKIMYPRKNTMIPAPNFDRPTSERFARSDHTSVVESPIIHVQSLTRGLRQLSNPKITHFSIPHTLVSSWRLKIAKT
ncbi:hypothetical protein Fot_31475 [Forsythia ovata]|uniref:Uncharacterized protein n=1 Tax=Forsythia ovata TaxID=205694 RepID=A0ABD1T5M1_9LAMI